MGHHDINAPLQHLLEVEMINASGTFADLWLILANDPVNSSYPQLAKIHRGSVQGAKGAIRVAESFTRIREVIVIALNKIKRLGMLHKVRISAKRITVRAQLACASHVTCCNHNGFFQIIHLVKHFGNGKGQF